MIRDNKGPNSSRKASMNECRLKLRNQCPPIHPPHIADDNENSSSPCFGLEKYFCPHMEQASEMFKRRRSLAALVRFAISPESLRNLQPVLERSSALTPKAPPQDITPGSLSLYPPPVRCLARPTNPAQRSTAQHSTACHEVPLVFILGPGFT